MRLPPLLIATLFVSAAALSPLRSADAAGSPESKLAALGHKLPPTSKPVANYIPAVRTGNLVFLAGHISRGADGKVITGKLGRDLTVEQGATAARHTALALLATLKQEIGDLAKVKRIVRVGGFVNSVENFTQQPQVMNGCSDLLVAVFGEKGKHARAALGMAALPLDCAVEIEMVVEVQ
jgi:enamine deaminase RidA (YjgF/YER057c/UK114 family)